MSKTKILKTTSLFLIFFLMLSALIFLSACKEDHRHNLNADDITFVQQEFVFNGYEQKPEIIVKNKNTTYTQNVDYAVFYENNIKAGMAKIIVSAMDSSKKLKGRVEKPFKIDKLNIENAQFEIQDLTFSGDPTVLPQIKIKVGQKEISTSEFDISQTGGFPDTTNTVSIVSKANSNFVGSKQIPYIVNYLKLDDCFVQIERTTYDGTAKTPNFGIVCGNIHVPQSVFSNFNITFENNVLASDEAKLSITVVGQNHYFAQNDQTEVLFRINKANISSSQIAQIDDKQYDGTQSFKVDPEVVMFNRTLEKDSDYDVRYFRDNIEIFDNSSFVDGGTINILITGKNNFEGEINTSYFIKGIDITQDPNLLIEIDDDGLIFNSFEQTPPITITYLGDEIYSYQIDFLNNINAGNNTAKVIINFFENFAGTIEQTFSIQPRPIVDFLFSLESQNATFLPQGAQVVVTLKEFEEATPLSLGQDFVLSYEDNNIVSTPSQKAKVKAVGINNYCGETDFVEFDVLMAEITLDNISGFSENFLFDGTEKKQNIQITISDQNVSVDDYEIKYYSNINNKTPQTDFVSANQTIYMEIIAKNNIFSTDEIVFSYTISTNELKSNNTQITLSENEFLFDGTEKTPSISSFLFCSSPLDSTNYDISFQNNINAGTATIIISGKNNVFGAIEQEFTILQKNLSNEMITFKNDSTYNTQTQNLEPVVYDALITANDYGVNYYKLTDGAFVQIEPSEVSNIKNAGTYLVEVVGKQNFKGTISKQIIIKKTENILIKPLEIKNWQYGTNQVFPQMTSSFGTPEFYYSKRNDFNFSQVVPTEIGQYTLKGIVEESENYFEIVSFCDFEITKTNLENAEIIIKEISLQSGNVENLSVDIIVGQKLLTSSDYSYSYIQNGNSLTISVEAKNDSLFVTGEKEQTFDIKNSQEITINCENTYNYGENVVISCSTQNNENVDYTIYKITQTHAVEVLNGAPLDAGNYVVIAICEGNNENYKTVQTKEFVVMPQQYAEENFALTGFDELSYSGQNVLLNHSIYNSTLERTLEENKDYFLSVSGDVVGGQNITITINFIGNYAGEVVKNLSIAKKILFGNETISTPYTGTEIAPQVRVFDENMIEGINYDVLLYSNEERTILASSTEKTNAGILFGIIKAKNNEFEDILFTLEITKQVNKFNSEFCVPSVEFGDSISKPTISSKFGETKIYYAPFNAQTKVLGEFLEWTDSQKPTNVGTYYLKALTEETDSYFGLQTETIFEITKQEIKRENITLSFGGNNYGADDTINITYQEGTAQIPEITILDKAGNALNETNQDYRVRYFKLNEQGQKIVVSKQNIIDAGTYVLNITDGKTNYTTNGGIDIIFNIVNA